MTRLLNQFPAQSGDALTGEMFSPSDRKILRLEALHEGRDLKRLTISLKAPMPPMRAANDGFDPAGNVISLDRRARAFADVPNNHEDTPPPAAPAMPRPRRAA